MDDIQLLVDLHMAAERQGPGGPTESLKALQLAGIDTATPLQIADIGCGTGASALLLARELNAQVTAVDLLPEFLEVLQQRAARAGLSDRIHTQCASMEALPFAEAAFDVIWSEGAIYNMSFQQGIAAWRRFLKPGGLLVVSEITWTTALRPAEIEQHWQAEYPEIDQASAKLASLESSGYTPVGYFTLPESCWMEHYYGPMQARFAAFLERHGHSEAARQIVAAEQREIDLYQRYKDYYSYGVYIARRLVQ